MTQRVALIGMPLRRRHSQAMHNAAFAHFAVDARYEVRELAPEDLRAFFEEVREPGWLGFQVTAPHKEEAARHCDEIEEEAAAIGAINSGVRDEGGRLTGFNTDASGFLRSLEADLACDLAEATVVVAGAGGAARAVVHACLSGGARRVVVANRHASRAADLAEATDPARVEGVAIDSPDFSAALGGADLAVNATTLNTSPVFDVGLLSDDAAVFDLVYVPAVTPLVAAARARGLRAVAGAGMLVAQAEAAFRRWTGITGAENVMAVALAPLLNQAQ